MIPVERIRAVALALPGSAKREGDTPAFLVADQVFAEVLDGGTRLRVRTGDGDKVMPLDDDADWQLIEDGVARSWELAAPTGLLEAGGR